MNSCASWAVLDAMVPPIVHGLGRHPCNDRAQGAVERARLPVSDAGRNLRPRSQCPGLDKSVPVCGSTFRRLMRGKQTLFINTYWLVASFLRTPKPVALNLLMLSRIYPREYIASNPQIPLMSTDHQMVLQTHG